MIIGNEIENLPVRRCWTIRFRESLIRKIKNIPSISIRVSLNAIGSSVNTNSANFKLNSDELIFLVRSISVEKWPITVFG